MFLELISTRRSIRQFTPQPLTGDQIAVLTEAALRAPSSRGMNPWEFVVVTDAALLARLAAVKPHGAAFLSGAALAIAVCADPRRCDVWVEDATIAATYIQLAAHDLGLGSCWVQIRLRAHADGRPSGAAVADLLALPPQVEVEVIVAVGHPAEKKKPHPVASLQREKLWHNRHGQPLAMTR